MKSVVLKCLLGALVSLLLLFGCSNPDTHPFEITAGNTIDGVPQDAEDLLAGSAVEFAQEMLRGYRIALTDIVPAQFQEKFLLNDSATVAGWAVLSTLSESVIHIYPSDRPAFKYYLTKLPAQFVAFRSLDTLSEKLDSLRWVSPLLENDVLSGYDRWTVPIGIADGIYAVHSTESGRIVAGTPRLLRLGKHSLVSLSDLDFAFATDDSVLHIARYWQWTVFTGDVGWQHVMSMARVVGASMLRAEVDALLRDSEWFRIALADPVLSDEANRIVDRFKAWQDDPTAYSYWEYLKDMEDLSRHSAELGIEDTSYVGNMVKALVERNVPFLLWAAESPLGYMCQWLILNAAIFLLIPFFFLLYRFHAVRQLIGPSIVRLVLHGCPLFMNGYAVSSKPESFALNYWILPVALLLVYIVLVDFFLRKKFGSPTGRTAEGS